MQIIEIIPPKQARSFDKPPIFNINEQQKYFKQEPILQELLCQIRKPEAKAGLLLQYGYFKATKRFFQKEDFKKKDIIFISKCLSIYEPYAYTCTQTLYIYMPLWYIYIYICTYL